MDDDHRRFNIRGEDGLYLCSACWFPGCFPQAPYVEGGGLVGVGICPCCFFEPGFDDQQGASADAEPTVSGSILKYRAAWTADGMPWLSTLINAPAGWNPEVQLARLIARHPDADGGAK